LKEKSDKLFPLTVNLVPQALIPQDHSELSGETFAFISPQKENEGINLKSLLLELDY
jgi:hypothetical protein